jgi:hypothetical protein
MPLGTSTHRHRLARACAYGTVATARRPSAPLCRTASRGIQTRHRACWHVPTTRAQAMVSAFSCRLGNPGHTRVLRSVPHLAISIRVINAHFSAPRLLSGLRATSKILTTASHPVRATDATEQAALSTIHLLGAQLSHQIHPVPCASQDEMYPCWC